MCFIISLVGFNLEREFNCNVHSPNLSETSAAVLTRNSLQAWLRFVLVRADLPALGLIDDLPSSQHGLRRLLRHSS